MFLVPTVERFEAEHAQSPDRIEREAAAGVIRQDPLDPYQAGLGVYFLCCLAVAMCLMSSWPHDWESESKGVALFIRLVPEPHCV